jgi:putative ABC transport system substrate-binding protein
LRDVTDPGNQRAVERGVLPHAVINANRARIASLAARHRLPGMYPDSEYVEAGGLMSYAANNSDQQTLAVRE